jgi:hypothetical protein
MCLCARVIDPRGLWQYHPDLRFYSKSMIVSCIDTRCEISLQEIVPSTGAVVLLVSHTMSFMSTQTDTTVYFLSAITLLTSISKSSILLSMMRMLPLQNSGSSIDTPKCFCTTSSAVIRPGKVGILVLRVMRFRCPRASQHCLQAPIAIFPT